jgi:hypothetical protein
MDPSFSHARARGNPGETVVKFIVALKQVPVRDSVVLCAGPERAGQTIREALAKGADRAIHELCDDVVRLSTLSLARRLAAAAAIKRQLEDGGSSGSKCPCRPCSRSSRVLARYVMRH